MFFDPRDEQYLTYYKNIHILLYSVKTDAYLADRKTYFVALKILNLSIYLSFSFEVFMKDKNEHENGKFVRKVIQ
jgi:hypothetical protein